MDDMYIQQGDFIYMRTAKAIMDKPVDQSATSLASQVDTVRQITNRSLDERRRSEMGQFMTPAPVAKLMASMFGDLTGQIHLLDAGAGVGSLTAAFVAEACSRRESPEFIRVNAYETEKILAEKFQLTAAWCAETCAQSKVGFSSNLLQEDFIERATRMLTRSLFCSENQLRFNRAILNPPYRKINNGSRTRKLLRQAGIETTNLYTGFVALAIQLLEDGGELVAITPRSFCNGPYFRPFRKLLLNTTSLDNIHIFHSRTKAFREDAVLQENIIFHVTKERRIQPVTISSSACAEDINLRKHIADYQQVVSPNDPDLVIHITTTEDEGSIAARARSLPCSLRDLGIEVSTGRVVDFRTKRNLRDEPNKDSVPLIYANHFENGFVQWPQSGSRKPNALIDSNETANLLVPNGTYLLVKRFSSKEERRRVVAAVYDPNRIKADYVGFENHLNYYHINGKGIAKNVAKGLALFLNSTLVDQYFRQFSGHTQVNATDLRNLRYPSLAQLKRMGNHVRRRLPDQERIDAILQQTLSRNAA